MDDVASSSDGQRKKTVFDLDPDSLSHCASNLSLQDLSNMAMTCKFFRQVAYSDSIWLGLFREHWPLQYTSSSLSQKSRAREAYLARRTALHQFKFHDPFITEIFRLPSPFRHILLEKDRAYFAQGRSQRCLRGHSGPVTTLSDKLLGDSGGDVLASGGEDGTVRLWSLNCSGKRGQKALKSTFYGHEKPLALLSVSGHNPSLLVSVSIDAKVRVWDTNVSSSAHSSGCVGLACVNGTPVGVSCHEALCYIAAGCTVTAIDLRTMKKVSTAAMHQPEIYSFQSLPSKSLICTGGYEKVMLWDIRRNQEKLQPVVNMDGHSGPVTHLHVDPYKIVTGGPKDSYVKIWETDTGIPINSFTCCILDDVESRVGLSAMAVNGCRIITSCCGEEVGRICIRDFTHASSPILSDESSLTSKFWEPLLQTDS